MNVDSWLSPVFKKGELGEIQRLSRKKLMWRNPAEKRRPPRWKTHFLFEKMLEQRQRLVSCTSRSEK